MKNPNLSAEEVTFSYGRGKEIFGPFTFSASGGEIWAVLGSNGAGKSTLFKILSGEFKPLSGRTSISGSVEFIPQGVSIPGRLTVCDVFEYLALLRGVPAAARGIAVAKAIETVNLENQAHKLIKELSGGQQRRAVIGQALVGDPSVLLMDEPSAGLDLDQRNLLRKTVAKLGESRIVMVSSHIVEDLAGIVTHVIHMKRGKIIFAGSRDSYLNIISREINPSGEVEEWIKAYHAWNDFS